MKKLLVVAALAGHLLAGVGEDSGLAAQEKCELPSSVTIASETGGSMQEMRGGMPLNRGSTLMRDWVVIHDDRLPVDFDGTPGVAPLWVGRSEIQYDTRVTLAASEPATAVNARFVTFDVFGEHVTTLGVTEVVDLTPGEPRAFTWRWRVGENDAAEHFASIAFIASVRTADGQVHTADYETIVCVVELFALAATVADLDPSGK